MSLTVILVGVFVGLVLYSLLKKKSRYHELLDKIPEPPADPIVGHLFDMMATPEIRFKKFRERSMKCFPLYKIRIANKNIVQMVLPEDVELLLKNMKHISKGDFYQFLHAWLGTGLLTSTGAKWQSRRKILTPAFHFSILQEFIHIFNEEAEDLVKDLEKECNAPFINIVNPITKFTLKSIAETSMGLDINISEDDKESYRKAVDRFGKLVVTRMSRPWLYNDKIYSLTDDGKDYKAQLKTLHGFSKKVILERKRQFDDSFSYAERKRLAMLDLLLKYQHDGANIDEEGIREEVDTFMFEGHDTTAMALTYCLLVLANHKEAQEKILDEMDTVIGASKYPTYAQLQELKYTERVIKECLRLYPSVPLMARKLGEEIETVSGYTLPKDCVVIVAIYDMHHNPNIFPDPEKFDPDRFLPENAKNRHPFAYIPFSAGARNCIGQKFAILELKAALCAITRRFVLEAVDKREDIVLISDMVLRTKGPVRVKFVPRS